MILLDTTFLIDLLKERKNAVDRAKELVVIDKLATTNINVYELLLGVYSNKNVDHKKRVQDVENLLDKLEVLTLDKQSAMNSAKIGGELASRGQIIGDTDNMIAGIALSNGINTIVTRDKEHFERIKGINVESY